MGWEARVRRGKRGYAGEGTEERGWRRWNGGVEGEERNEKVRCIKYKEEIMGKRKRLFGMKIE